MKKIAAFFESTVTTNNVLNASWTVSKNRKKVPSFLIFYASAKVCNSSTVKGISPPISTNPVHDFTFLSLNAISHEANDKSCLIRKNRIHFFSSFEHLKVGQDRFVLISRHNKQPLFSICKEHLFKPLSLLGKRFANQPILHCFSKELFVVHAHRIR